MKARFRALHRRAAVANIAEVTMRFDQSKRQHLPRGLALPALSAITAIFLIGCNRAEAPTTAPTSPSSSAPAAAAPVPGNPSPGTAEGAAASLPSSASAGKPAGTGMAADAKETDPKGNMNKQEESQGMPKALQSNNHSSPALDRDASKP